MKIALSVAAVAGAFIVVLLGGGNAVGVWDELELPATSAAADRAVQTLTGRRGTDKLTPSERRAKARAKARRTAASRWVRAANQICRRAKAERIGERKPDTLAEVEGFVSRLAELNARYNRELTSLPPPPDRRAKVERLRKLLAKEQRLIEGLRDAVHDRDPRRMLELSDRVLVVDENASQILYDLGALECAL